MTQDGMRRLSIAVISSAFADILPDDSVKSIKRELKASPSKWQRMDMQKALLRDKSARHFFENQAYTLWADILDMRYKDIDEAYEEVLRCHTTS